LNCLHLLERIEQLEKNLLETQDLIKKLRLGENGSEITSDDVFAFLRDLDYVMMKVLPYKEHEKIWWNARNSIGELVIKLVNGKKK
jgi:hypothetical protein